MRLDTLRIVHPFPSVLVAGLTAAIVPVANPQAPPSLYLVLGLSMLMFQFAIGVVNDIVDVEEDRHAKPWKPLARGDLAPRGARWLAGALVAGGLLLTSILPPAAWAIGALGLATGLAYDLWLKRTPLSWLPYSIALPLIPIWVHVAAGAWIPALWSAVPLGALLGLALHLANQAPDATGDRGLAHRLGERTSRIVAIACFGVVASVVALLVVPVSPRSALFPALLGASVVGVSPYARVLGRDGLFGLLAVGSACLAIPYLVLVL